MGFCQVDGCEADLVLAKDYHKRYKVCEQHMHATSVSIQGDLQRYCQQCGRFHPLDKFDSAKRSCRFKLARHNALRRKKLSGVQQQSKNGKVAAARAVRIQPFKRTSSPLKPLKSPTLEHTEHITNYMQLQHSSCGLLPPKDSANQDVSDMHAISSPNSNHSNLSTQDATGLADPKDHRPRQPTSVDLDDLNPSQIATPSDSGQQPSKPLTDDSRNCSSDSAPPPTHTLQSSLFQVDSALEAVRHALKRSTRPRCGYAHPRPSSYVSQWSAQDEITSSHSVPQPSRQDYTHCPQTASRLTASPFHINHLKRPGLPYTFPDSHPTYLDPQTSSHVSRCPETTTQRHYILPPMHRLHPSPPQGNSHQYPNHIQQAQIPSTRNTQIPDYAQQQCPSTSSRPDTSGMHDLDLSHSSTYPPRAPHSHQHTSLPTMSSFPPAKRTAFPPAAHPPHPPALHSHEADFAALLEYGLGPLPDLRSTSVPGHRLHMIADSPRQAPHQHTVDDLDSLDDVSDVDRRRSSRPRDRGHGLDAYNTHPAFERRHTHHHHHWHAAEPSDNVDVDVNVGVDDELLDLATSYQLSYPGHARTHQPAAPSRLGSASSLACQPQSSMPQRAQRAAIPPSRSTHHTRSSTRLSDLLSLLGSLEQESYPQHPQRLAPPPADRFASEWEWDGDELSASEQLSLSILRGLNAHQHQLPSIT